MVTNDELARRLDRVYAALEATLESDISKAPPIVRSNGRRTAIFQDFKGGLSDAEMENLAHSAIHNLANLYDHTRNWLKKNGHDPKQVDSFISANLSVAVIQDLSNNDKHGYPPRNGGVSGKAPKLVNVHRMMRLSTGKGKGSGVGFLIKLSGEQKIVGAGDAKLIVTGEVRDVEGNIIGELHMLQGDALGIWENLLRSFGLLQQA